MKTIDTFSKIAQMGKRVRVIQGGTSAGKTYSILQLLIVLAQKSEEALLISVVSESMPHLKRGAMRDFIQILSEEGVYSENNHNKTDNTYKIGKSVIEFFSADQPDKLRGARRDVLFINECNNLSHEAYNQLEVRTKKIIFLDYNPTTEFWVHDDVLKQEDSSFVIVTYADNCELDQTIIKSIEKRKPRYNENKELIGGDPNWWRVYGEGQVGVYEGLVFQDYEVVDGVPNATKLIGYGLDFGYTNDPTALCALYEIEDEIYIDELIYEKGLVNDDIADRMENLGIDRVDEVIADCAEPKSIEELCRRGLNVKPAKKGKDSIKFGIDLIKQFNLKITKNSTNLIKELRNYHWIEDKNGKSLNKPVDDWNHMIDAARYLMMAKKGAKQSNDLQALRARVRSKRAKLNHMGRRTL